MEIKGFRDVTLMDWSGVVASVIFVGGCNFRCMYCHNHALAFAPSTLDSILEDEIFEKLGGMKDWIDGVIISGGEPTLYRDKLEEMLKRLKKNGLKTKIFTNGSLPAVLGSLVNGGLLNAVSMDLKHRPERYSEIVKFAISDLGDRINRSIDLIKNADVECEFRMTVVKGIHSLDDIKAVAELVSPKRLILQNVNESDIPDDHREMIVPFSAEEFEQLQKFNRQGCGYEH